MPVDGVSPRGYIAHTVQFFFGEMFGRVLIDASEPCIKLTDSVPGWPVSALEFLVLFQSTREKR